MTTPPHNSLLRVPGTHAAEVKPVELFFDLVYVLAITQINHHLHATFELRGATEAGLLLLAVWIGWIHIVWISNYFEVSARPVRLALMALMLAGLIMSAALPEAFGERGLALAATLITIQAGASLAALLAVGRGHPLQAVFGRVLVWCLICAVFWIAGGLTANADARLGLWAVAAGLSYLATWLGFPLPGFGHSRTSDYTITADHLAERFRSIIIIVLGESILVTGVSFGERPITVAVGLAFVVAFAGSAALWWLHFDRAEEAGRRVLAAARDPGRYGLWSYTFFHLPMVAGIIASAASDELVLTHPTEPARLAGAALILGGPALYLIGNVLYKWSMWGHVMPSRLVALAALAALIPAAFFTSALTLATAATLVLIALALSDLRYERRHPELFAEPEAVASQSPHHRRRRRA